MARIWVAVVGWVGFLESSFLRRSMSIGMGLAVLRRAEDLACDELAPRRAELAAGEPILDLCRHAEFSTRTPSGSEMSSSPAFPFADSSLAVRLEMAEGRTNAWFVETRARLEPSVGAAWREIGGAFVLFDGVGSPLTQTFGLGMVRAVTTRDLESIEDFFLDRGAAVEHEISPLADSGILPLLRYRGYFPVEFSSVLYRPIAADLRLADRRGAVSARRLQPGEEDLWAEVSAEGWSESAALAEFILAIGRISARSQGSFPFLAELDGRPIAAGGLSIVDGLALLSGASTVPSGRQRGAQLALLEARLRYAAEQGCDIALMAAQPGSASQRNAERQGFRIAYTRIKWRKQ